MTAATENIDHYLSTTDYILLGIALFFLVCIFLDPAVKLAERMFGWVATRFMRTGPKLRVRIYYRSSWLIFKRWCEETLTLSAVLSFCSRPVLVLTVGLGLPIVLGTVLGYNYNDLVGQLTPTSEVDWRTIAQPLLILVGLPAAFVLWAFRDHNAKKALENQRKDINLKEFQEIQIRAADAMDPKLSEKARKTMQIAAIHQLLPFLKGEYGESFRRPAWELLRARLEMTSQELGLSAITQWTDARLKTDTEDENLAESAFGVKTEIREAGDEIIGNTVAQAERSLLSSEARSLMWRDLPVERSYLDGMAMAEALFPLKDFWGTSFADSFLFRAHFEYSRLHYARFEGAFLKEAHLECAFLKEAHFEGAYLEGARLDGADLEGAHMLGATFDNDTRFKEGWDAMSETEKEEIRAEFIARGMIHVDTDPEDTAHENVLEDATDTST